MPGYFLALPSWLPSGLQASGRPPSCPAWSYPPGLGHPSASPELDLWVVPGSRDVRAGRPSVCADDAHAGELSPGGVQVCRETRGCWAGPGPGQGFLPSPLLGTRSPRHPPPPRGPPPLVARSAFALCSAALSGGHFHQAGGPWGAATNELQASWAVLVLRGGCTPDCRGGPGPWGWLQGGRGDASPPQASSRPGRSRFTV